MVPLFEMPRIGHSVETTKGFQEPERAESEMTVNV